MAEPQSSSPLDILSQIATSLSADVSVSFPSCLWSHCPNFQAGYNTSYIGAGLARAWSTCRPKHRVGLAVVLQIASLFNRSFHDIYTSYPGRLETQPGRSSDAAASGSAIVHGCLPHDAVGPSEDASAEHHPQFLQTNDFRTLRWSSGRSGRVPVLAAGLSTQGAGLLGSDSSVGSSSRGNSSLLRSHLLRVQVVFTDGPKAGVHALTFVACLPECLTASISRSSSLVITWKHTASS